MTLSKQPGENNVDKGTRFIWSESGETVFLHSQIRKGMGNRLIS